MTSFVVKKGSKTRANTSGEMPLPLSFTVRCTTSPTVLRPISTRLTPRSELRIAFSMAFSALASNGLISITRGSGDWNVASCCSGVGVP